MSANLFFWLTLIALLGFYTVDAIANRLNVRALRPELPPEFRGVYDENEYRKLLRYNAATARFDFVDSTFNLAVLLVFWFCGGFEILDRIVRHANIGPIACGLSFIGALWFGHWLINLPFDIYSTFRIEQQFGFNKTTPRTFVADQIKSLLLTIILGGALLALVLTLFEKGGARAWLHAWIAVSALLFVFVYIAPAIILPLFNKFTPLEDGELKRAILDYGRAQNFPIGGIFVMDGSRRSTKSNAFFTGFGKTKKIALFDTLIANHSVAELVAVLAHEIGHYKLRHVLQHLIVAIANIGIFLLLAEFFMHSRGLFDAFGISHTSVYAGLALFLVLYNPLSRLLSIARLWQSRRHEFAADSFAATTTSEPQTMIDALKKLSRTNLANLAPHPLYVALYHSHPPILQRIAALQRVG